jgi:cytoskeletal protein RodZ
MVDSVGKKLSQTRLKRGLTLEEVAHVTKLRPDKIVALETDDYSSFPSNAYAKGFLQIYARYLRVDVSEFLSSLDSSNSISVEDYQYLSNAPTPKPAQPVRRERRPPSIAPLVFFILVVLVGLGLWWFVTNYQRTLPTHALDSASDTEESSTKPQQSTPSPAFAAGAETKPEKPAMSSGARPLVTPAPAPAAGLASAASPRPLVSPSPKPAQGGAVAANTPAPGPVNAPTPRVGSIALSDRDFVTPTSVPTPDRAALTSPRSGLNEVLVASIKKTWVTIRRDDPKAPPIFEDYIYPNTNPLKLKGARFFIDARDPTSVQITKNGLPFAYPDANVPVQ